MDKRIVKAHWDKDSAFVAVAILFLHPDGIAELNHCPGPGVIAREAALSPEQSSVLLPEPYEGRRQALIID